VYVIAILSLVIVALPSGIFLDRYGPRITVAVGSSGLLCGCILLAFSSQGI
jgi:fucose permease